MASSPLTDATIEMLVKMTEAAVALSLAMRIPVAEAMRMQLQVFQQTQRTLEGFPPVVTVAESTRKH